MRRASAPLLVVATVLLLTLTLRVPTASVGPVVPAIGSETGYGPPVLALLTSVPLLCFLVIAPAVPALQARLGLRSLEPLGQGWRAALAFWAVLPRPGPRAVRPRCRR